MIKGIATALVTLLIVILVLYLTFVCTKYIGRGVGIKTRSRNMKMLDQIPLGRDRSAAIIEAGNRFFLVGITASQVSLISELKEEEVGTLLLEPQEPERLAPDFGDIFEKLKNRKKKDG